MTISQIFCIKNLVGNFGLINCGFRHMLGIMDYHTLQIEKSQNVHIVTIVLEVHFYLCLTTTTQHNHHIRQHRNKQKIS